MKFPFLLHNVIDRDYFVVSHEEVGSNQSNLCKYLHVVPNEVIESSFPLLLLVAKDFSHVRSNSLLTVQGNDQLLDDLDFLVCLRISLCEVSLQVEVHICYLCIQKRILYQVKLKFKIPSGELVRV